MWSRKHSRCVECGTTERPHRARGLCRICYGRLPDYKDRHNARNRKRRSTPEGKAQARDFYRRNLEHRRQLCWVTSMERRAREHGCAGEVTAEQALARIAYYGGRCWMCGESYECIDHVKPLAEGGHHLPANLRPACQSCNSRKRDLWSGLPEPGHSMADHVRELVAA